MTRSILFVDDEDQLRDLVVEALQDLGYEVLVATDGPGALEILRGPARIDAMLSDVSMPNGVSGVELAAQAAGIRPGIAVVLSSGFAKAQLPAMPKDAMFLAKPYRIHQLIECLDQAIAKAAPH